jgi:hypothetical protein
MSGSIRDPGFWRDLAIETRQKAEAFSIERREKNGC